mgnify:FL=1
MRRTVFFAFLAIVMMMTVGTGCTEKKAALDDTLSSDSLLADTSDAEDSLETIISEEPMPKAADELFDDFFFNFAANRRLQRERIDFPLAVNSYGKMTSVTQRRWRTEHFFMHQGYYTLVFNNARQLDIVKDTTVGNVYVERISFEKKQVKRWIFRRMLGLWKMQGVTLMPLAKHEDAHFLHFYDEFSTDSVTQMHSLADQVSFSGPDPDDDFSRMTGELMPEQWPMFAPWMPSGTIYNIHYGEKPYKPSSTRVFVIRGIANGMETEMTFKKHNGHWLLEKLNT